ncbi:protein-methionine-sulfoxide reductase heme-binding subunit MsrQ [Microvirga sp. 3-52]|uniref:protein-methionine-sulfoxide reductase heme-binding subunit MsrQ n=1 Tax=Microvirga sp. 3-52 TaxID=2792425 RepID=UPI001ACA8AAC|nr:protein-methionine-sulfoxide reductase heme-binding subunit MsrQ [Microvirga sp. 3-52]MBO1903521.1 protein-methionine-sulfoxide reductase heme-binding subunit MsrQ [Microvirga sp. 3-52]MBS7450882.1 protein-methionine-sulfoxide reductase heme-binding subunit MsrQ [Microvirga sp. 3-52]
MAGRASVQADKKSLALPQVPKIAIYLVGFIPAIWLFYAGITDQLGADPMRYLEQGLGLWALRFLIATLTITPLRQLFNINLLRYRRALGLIAFYYAALHLVTYLVLDQGLDVSAIVADIVKRPYITIGMATFVILVPLALTSNNASIRRMGGQAWAKLHRLVYLAAIGAALHFLLVVKSWPPEPLVYAAIVAVLLGYRLIRSTMKKTSPRRRLA